MKKQQQTIECGRCGETRQEFLTAEELKRLKDVAGPIYRDCIECGKTTGWVSSTHSPAATKEPMPQQGQNQPVGGQNTGNQPRAGQERMATQAERDRVDSMVHSNVKQVPCRPTERQPASGGQT